MNKAKKKNGFSKIEVALRKCFCACAESSCAVIVICSWTLRIVHD